MARLRNRRASRRRLSDVRRRREDHIRATLLPRLNPSILFHGGCGGLARIARLRARRYEGRPRIHLCRLPGLVTQSDDDADPGRRQVPALAPLRHAAGLLVGDAAGSGNGRRFRARHAALHRQGRESCTSRRAGTGRRLDGRAGSSGDRRRGSLRDEHAGAHAQGDW